MEDLNTYWVNLENDSRNLDRDIILRKINPIGLHIGFNIINNQRLIVLELPENINVEQLRFPNWNGILFEFGDIERGLPVVFLRLKSLEFKDIFCAIANDLTITLENISDKFKSLQVFTECIIKWKMFFEKHGLQILSREQQIGLIGELYFLSNYIIPNTSFLDALSFWRGHERKNQDFEFPNGNVEVKTTSQKEHTKVYIANEKQLDDTGISNLFLYCLCLNEPVQNGISLTTLVFNINQKFESSPYAKLKFRDFLIEAGYLNEHQDFYNHPVYSVVKEFFFKINNDFPRIITIPTGTGDLKYTVNLSLCVPFLYELDRGLSLLLEKSEDEALQ